MSKIPFEVDPNNIDVVSATIRADITAAVVRAYREIKSATDNARLPDRDLFEVIEQGLRSQIRMPQGNGGISDVIAQCIRVDLVGSVIRTYREIEDRCPADIWPPDNELFEIITQKLRLPPYAR
jgi:hypothetical protein